MKMVEINGKQVSVKRIAAALEKQYKGRDKRSLEELLESTPEPPEPEYKALVLAVKDDPLAAHLARTKLDRGVEGFGGIDPLLHMAEFLVDLYVRVVRRKGPR